MFCGISATQSLMKQVLYVYFIRDLITNPKEKFAICQLHEIIRKWSLFDEISEIQNITSFVSQNCCSDFWDCIAGHYYRDNTLLSHLACANCFLVLSANIVTLLIVPQQRKTTRRSTDHCGFYHHSLLNSKFAPNFTTHASTLTIASSSHKN